MQVPNRQPNAEAGVIVNPTMEIMEQEASHLVAVFVSSQKIETKPEASAKRNPQTNTA